MNETAAASPKSKLPKLAASLALTIGAGLLGGLFSMNAKDVFNTLEKPAFAPPSWVFMPVWTILFILMGIAFYRVWTSGADTRAVKSALFYFFVQLVFNVLWSVLFFSLGLYGAAFADLVILLLYIIITTYKFFKIDKAAGFLMLPYLLWVVFAGVLNLTIVMLNR